MTHTHHGSTAHETSSQAALSTSAKPTTGLEGEALFQLIKRSEIDHHEVEDATSQAVEVSVLWKTSILHVAHLEGGRDFVLTSLEGTRREDPSRFVMDAAMLGLEEAPVVLHQGGSRFVFLPGATGEVELQGARRSLEDLKAQGLARPSSEVPGGYEVSLQPEGRYRQELSGLTFTARVVAPGRKVVGKTRREPRLVAALVGAGALVAAAVLTMHVAVSNEQPYLSQASDDDRLSELRAFIQRQNDRQPEASTRPEAEPQRATQGGTGTAHVGPQGSLGSRTSTNRNGRYGIRNHGEQPHLANQSSRDQLRSRGVFAALGAPGGGMSGGSSGIVSPFGQMTESGLDDRDANGNMTGDTVSDAFGYGGLGATGTGWGGGGNGEGTIGQGTINTMGHGSGRGPGFGDSVATRLRPRPTAHRFVDPRPPVISGLLSPDAVRRVVLRNLGQVNHCYEQGLATNPSAAGRVVVRFVIGGTGTVMSSQVADSSIPIPSVGTCISQAVRRWQFTSPENGGVVTVNYPFNLQPAD